MRYFIKNIYFILLLITILFLDTETFGKDSKVKYSRNNISNYLSGIVSVNQDYTNAAFKYLNKVQSLKNDHSNFNVQFIRTLILLEKFNQAFAFSKDVWLEDEYFFETDLLLGLEFFIKNDYLNAEKHFERLNKISRYNLLFEDFLGNILIAWIKASENNKEDSFKFLDKVPERYHNLKKIQNSFLQCYFDTSKTQIAFEQLMNNEDSDFSRYNFFFANYLLFKNKNIEAEKVINLSRKTHKSNLLIKQTENFILTGNSKKIKNLFNCKNPVDVIAEIFYVIANIYSTEKNYQLSNFYLKISFFLNNKFTPNKTLLAENFFYQQKYELSKKIYNSLKSIGPVYSWYASINLAIILSDIEDKEYAVFDLEDEFNLLLNPDLEHNYELANFFKDREYYQESIKYYSLALQNIKQNHFLFSKILDRRGTSYERLGDWDNAEKDLKESLRILPDQPHVLNYLGYSWIDRGINIDKALEMIIRANELKKNDGYITDSLGWAFYVKKNYLDAEKFLQRAVEILPLDPIINDHYADTLWMLNKHIQARYFWKHVLGLDTVEQKLKDNVSKKLIFGIANKS
jgi:tetratricopeptide (TPR) repeat protein